MVCLTTTRLASGGLHEPRWHMEQTFLLGLSHSSGAGFCDVSMDCRSDRRAGFVGVGILGLGGSAGESALFPSCSRRLFGFSGCAGCTAWHTGTAVSPCLIHAVAGTLWCMYWHVGTGGTGAILPACRSRRAGQEAAPCSGDSGAVCGTASARFFPVSLACMNAAARTACQSRTPMINRTVRM